MHKMQKVLDNSVPITVNFGDVKMTTVRSMAARIEQDIRTQRGVQVPMVDPSANPLQEAFDNYEIMRDELAAAEAELKQLRQQATGLLTENEGLRNAVVEQKGFYQEQIALIRKDRDMYQNYAVELRSRFSAIKEAITKAESEALQWAVKKLPAHDKLDERDPEQQSARDAVASLPRNSFPPAQYQGK